MSHPERSSKLQTHGGGDPKLCSLCPKMCRFACPVTQGTADEGATPTEMMRALLDARAGRRPWSHAAELMDRCTGCEACRPPCEHEQDIPGMLYEARAEAFAADALTDGTRALHQAHLDHGSPVGIDTHATLREHAATEDMQRKGRVLYWPGCRAIHDHPERLPREMKLLRALGAEHVSLPTRTDIPGCCGAALRVLGDATGFRVHAAGLEQYFNRQRTWVGGSADCVGAVRQGYPQAGVAITAEVLHLAEYLMFFAGALGDLGKARCEQAEAAGEALPTVIVHDSCGLHRRLGRGAAIYDVLEAATGTRPGSYGRSPDETACCGAGDFFDLRNPTSAAAVGIHSTQRPMPRGAWLVTGEPSCLGALRAARPDVQVEDVMGFLLSWLEPVL